jgi:ADP-ribose diphosphatase
LRSWKGVAFYLRNKKITPQILKVADIPIFKRHNSRMSKQKPEILNIEQVAQSRLFKIEQMELRFSNGEQRTYERLASRGHGAVLIVAMPDPDHFILVREYSGGVDRYELCFPKGKVEANEDMLEAANREMVEETGFGAKKLDFIKSVSIAPGYFGHTTHIILARDLYPDQAEGDEPEPLDVVNWAMDDIPAWLAHPECSEARSIAAIYLVKEFLNRP